jgi:thioredoxin reductase
MQTNSCPVAIIGAGPYGLSIGAHLRARGVDFQIFGTPMHAWRAQMPAGMFLKSEGFASNLHDPQGHYTLKRFCSENAIAYSDYGPAVPLDTFVAYGLSFQQKLVPEVQDKAVVLLEKSPEGFQLRFDDGTSLAAREVIVAVGISSFRYVPEELSHLPAELLSHSSDHHDLSRFRGRDVSVLGSGASALDLVALLHDAGATVRLIARDSSLCWNEVAQRPWWRRWYPLCGLGGGDWRKRFYQHGPMLFRLLPKKTRLQIVRTALGPCGGHPVRECVEQMPLFLEHVIREAQPQGSGLRLRLARSDGAESEVSTDHLLAATGFRVDLRRLKFLSEPLRSQLSATATAPVLSANFESAVPSLYFAGVVSASTFGPVMRFTLGARYTARRLSSHLARATAHEVAVARRVPTSIAAAD